MNRLLLVKAGNCSREVKTFEVFLGEEIGDVCADIAQAFGLEGIDYTLRLHGRIYDPVSAISKLSDNESLVYELASKVDYLDSIGGIAPWE